MMHVLIRHKVADYNRWKEAFDSHLNNRKRAGETGFRLFHSIEDPRELFLLTDWNSLTEARDFMSSDELKDTMEKAGVIGAPDVQYLEDARGSIAPRPTDRASPAKFSPALLTCARVLRSKSFCFVPPTRSGRKLRDGWKWPE